MRRGVKGKHQMGYKKISAKLNEGYENLQEMEGSKGSQEAHLCQVVDGDGEEENQDTVEKQFAQANRQASSLQTSLHEMTTPVTFSVGFYI